jgi:hypothetical protein
VSYYACNRVGGRAIVVMARQVGWNCALNVDISGPVNGTLGRPDHSGAGS